MKKAPTTKPSHDLRTEYNLADLKGGVRGKYFRRATEGTHLVLIDPDLVKLFPDSDSVNRALRLLAETAQSATAKRPRTRS